MSNFKTFINPAIFNAFNICPRQAWLMSRQMTADQESSYLGIGRLIDQSSFQRAKKKVYLADMGAMIDMVTRKDGKFYVAEIKKSSATLETGIFQLKYYLYLLHRKSITVKGLIKIPKEKKSMEVELREEDISLIEKKLDSLEIILCADLPPKAIRLKICPKCGHFEFCWS
ncbi:MAG: CRISPR-associated protein Cas4 [bacterium]